MNNVDIAVVLVVLLALAGARAFLQYENSKQERAARDAERLKLQDRFHAALDTKYAATMTEADRTWYANLPDWDRIPLSKDR